MIPNVEKLTADYLRDRGDVSTLVARRVVSKTPESTAASWVRVTVLGGAQDPDAKFDHLVPFTLQLDCYAGKDGGQPEADLLARTVRAAIVEIDQADHDDAVVSAGRINGYARVPDAEFEPARERYILTATVYAYGTA